MKAPFRLSAVAASFLLCLDASATNGYFSHGVGTHNKAQAGAGSAAPTMSIDIANNPAAAAIVDGKWDLGIALFSPRRSYETSESQLNGQFPRYYSSSTSLLHRRCSH